MAKKCWCCGRPPCPSGCLGLENPQYAISFGVGGFGFGGPWAPTGSPFVDGYGNAFSDIMINVRYGNFAVGTIVSRLNRKLILCSEDFPYLSTVEFQANVSEMWDATVANYSPSLTLTGLKLLVNSSAVNPQEIIYPYRYERLTFPYVLETGVFGAFWDFSVSFVAVTNNVQFPEFFLAAFYGVFTAKICPP